jgi:two-component system, chemotaxis family, protein-glutamate methylesterase/glutaminase
MIRVLVVDDSVVVRKSIAQGLSTVGGISVVGMAADPYEAREKIAELNPDVITLDIDMPRMDGLTFLEKLMKHHPMRVVIVSSLSKEGSEIALRALSLGAIDVVAKPSSQFSVPDVVGRLANAVRAASLANVRTAAPVSQAPPEAKPMSTMGKIVCIGSSTGGTRALEAILPSMPADGPAIVVVQHMPPQFTASFAERLNGYCAMQVAEATDGMPLAVGRVVIAPGGRHLMLERRGGRYYVRLSDDEAVNHFRPSVDVFFNSVARCAKSNALGIILTGMGCDGAAGMMAMRAAGSRTIAQDEHTSVVFGMPKAAIDRGAAEAVVPLDRMAGAILDFAAAQARIAAQEQSL